MVLQVKEPVRDCSMSGGWWKGVRATIDGASYVGC
ncbi:hypothetical protein QE397_000223 [Rhodococcus sp. SORGH_AS 301]|nr:hypothetical protein [Rhodococcus sp. SORGH_AS_0301]